MVQWRDISLLTALSHDRQGPAWIHITFWLIQIYVGQRYICWDREQDVGGCWYPLWSSPGNPPCQLTSLRGRCILQASLGHNGKLQILWMILVPLESAPSALVPPKSSLLRWPVCCLPFRAYWLLCPNCPPSKQLCSAEPTSCRPIRRKDAVFL